MLTPCHDAATIVRYAARYLLTRVPPRSVDMLTIYFLIAAYSRLPPRLICLHA